MPDTAEHPATIVHEKYERLVKLAQRQATIKAAVAHPCDDVSLQGAVEAARLHLIEPILVGPLDRMRRVADDAGIATSAHSNLSVPSTAMIRPRRRWSW